MKPEKATIKYPPTISSSAGIWDREFERFVCALLSGEPYEQLEQYFGPVLLPNLRELSNKELRGLPTQLPMDWALSAMIGKARDLINLWIDSGKDSTGNLIDSPADRNVEAIAQGRSSSMREILASLLADFPAYVRLRSDGVQEAEMTIPRVRLVNNDLRDSFEIYGREMAAYFVLQVLGSPMSRRISRCDGCRKNFIYQRSRLRPIPRVFCQGCKGKASVWRTQQSRLRRLETAAGAWLERGPGTDNDQKQFVADAVNKKHGLAVGRRWVSQNLKEISRRAEELRPSRKFDER